MIAVTLLPSSNQIRATLFDDGDPTIDGGIQRKGGNPS
jgi:hypothetical protein